jgi:lipoprotein NlpD
MKKGEMRPINKALFSTKVVKCYKQALCDRKFAFNLILFPSLICLLLSGCISTRHSSSGKSTPQTAGHSKENSQNHTVQKGDTLYSIAQIYDLDYKNLAEWNNLKNPRAINIGQQLRLSSPNIMVKPAVFALPDLEQPSPTVQQPISESTSAATLLKTEPKALRLPYSKQAIAKLKEPEEAFPAAVKNSENEKPTELNVAARDKGGIKWIWPTEGRVSSHFSESTKGVDISGKTGQPVLASAAGKVVYSGTGLRGYGKLIIIKHSNTYLSAYAHNNNLLVKEGQTVSRGQIIAEMGKTDSSLVRLHFEIRKNGKPVDPLQYFPRISSETAP